MNAYQKATATGEVTTDESLDSSTSLPQLRSPCSSRFWASRNQIWPKMSILQILVFLLLAIVTAFHIFFLWWSNGSTIGPAQRSMPTWANQADHLDNSLGLPPMYVISLPSRHDRKEDMEILRKAVGFHWAYQNATSSDDKVVDEILRRVYAYRSAAQNHSTESTGRGRSRLHWSKNIEKIALSSKKPIEIASSGFFSKVNITGVPSAIPNLTCAAQDQDAPPYTPDLPEHKLLTRSRIACWHSHVSLIERIANEASLDSSVSIIFEDDIDMELGISSYLRWIWSALPKKWDIVFLGHCWSDESHYPAIATRMGSPHAGQAHLLSLHPSQSPKCTHAYALTRQGARRLLLHLLYTPFAYSRPIDQAIAWLVQTKRLKSYSVVPSIIVQRKVRMSDVSAGTGSIWKDRLLEGVFNDQGKLNKV